MFALISSRSGSQSAMMLRWALQGHDGPLVYLLLFIFGSPEQEVLMVSYCDRSVSIIHRAAALNDNSSYTAWPIFNQSLQECCLGDSAKVAKMAPLQWARWPPEFLNVSRTEKSIDSKLGGKYWGDL